MNEAEEKTINTERFKKEQKQVCWRSSIREGMSTWDKYHTVEPKASPQCFPPSATKRDKAHGDASPNIVTNRRRDNGVHGAKKKPKGGAVTVQHSTSLRLAERTGLRFSRLDPILTEPIASQRSGGAEERY